MRHGRQSYFEEEHLENQKFNPEDVKQVIKWAEESYSFAWDLNEPEDRRVECLSETLLLLESLQSSASC